MSSKVGISGTNFVVNGQPFIFRGCNIEFEGLNIHYYGLPLPTLTQSTFDLLKSWKVNLLRISMHMEATSIGYNVWQEAFWTNLQTLLDLAEANGIYLLITPIMDYNMAPKFGGSGMPNWIFATASTQDQGWDVLYKAIVNKDPVYSQVEEAFRYYYQRIATMCKGRNIVMGFDIFNEPEYRNVAGYSRESATIFYEALAAYLTAIDNTKPIAVENNFISTRKPNIPNLFSSPHTYITANPGDSVSTIISRLVGYNGIGSSNTWQVPVISGEWWAPDIGATFTEAQSVAWTKDCVTAFAQLKWGSTVLRRGTQISGSNPGLSTSAAIQQTYLDYFALNTSLPPLPTGIPPVLALLGLVWLFLSTRK